MMYATLRADKVIEYTVGTFDQLTFNGNDLSNPWGVFSASQPLYFDQYVALYNRWLVYSCSIKATILSEVGTPTTFAIAPSTSATTVLDITRISEQPYGRAAFIGNQDGPGKAVMRLSMTTRKIRGETITDDDFSGQGPTTGPQRPWFWLTGANRHGGGTNDLWVRFVLTFRCRFFKRNLSAQS